MGRKSSSINSSGIRIAVSSASRISEAVSEAKLGLCDGKFQHIIVFFSSDYDAKALAEAFHAAFPDTPVSGCSTAGEIGPVGMTEGGMVLIAFPHEGFRIHRGLIEDVAARGVERASEIVRGLRSKLSQRDDKRLGERVFGVMLVDGLSKVEETLVAAVHWAFDDMQLPFLRQLADQPARNPLYASGCKRRCIDFIALDPEDVGRGCPDYFATLVHHDSFVETA